MSVGSSALGNRHRMVRVAALAREVTTRVGAMEPWRVLAGFLVLQWIETVAIARDVRHAGFLYYQGGDQLWYYTIGWLFTHGHFFQPTVSYLWALILAPFAVVAGPNLMQALPGIVILEVVVLGPIALLALYGIAVRLGGRIFAYWTLALWVALPIVGIAYTNTGYHQRYTEVTLPQSFGLTAMADFPAMVATLVAVYFCLRVFLDPDPGWLTSLCAGVASGAVIALKPSASIFLLGPALACVAARRFAHVGVLTAALLPAVVTLGVWKYRGFGHLPLLTGSAWNGVLTTKAAAAPVLALALDKYHNFDWAHLSHEFDLLREHFWSGRLIEWLVVAGLIGLARQSVRGALLVGGWFAAYVIVKGTYAYASIEDASMQRVLMPAFPAFVLLVAAVPLLVPGLAKRLRGEPGGLPSPGPRTRTTLLVAGLLLTAAVPLAAIAIATPVRGQSPVAAIIQQPPVPTEVDLGVHAVQVGRSVKVTWRAQHPAGGPVFYHVYRVRPSASTYTCAPGQPAPGCTITLTDLGVQRGTSFIDGSPARGAWSYRIGVAADWLDDVHSGDVYLVSRATTIAVR